MKLVLMEAERTCASAWVPVNGASEVQVRGLSPPDHVRIVFNGGHASLVFKEDGQFPLPDNVESVMAEARLGSGESCLSVDLV